MAPWYAACDIVLLTSEYEGVPYAVYEAMAMGTPVVAPDLPGISELITPEVGVLVAPRQDPQGYVTAVHALAAALSRRKEMGALARARARSEYSLERMAAEHGALYDELLGPDPDKPGASACVPSSHTQRQPPAAALRSRQRRGAPLVSVIVPCFNDGRYLADCLQSVAEQTYAPVETIVVDDASTDPETIDAFARIEAAGTITVLRMRPIGGQAPHETPRSRAREDGTSFRWTPTTCFFRAPSRSSSSSSREPGERIGFVYPNWQFFGNRKDYFEPASYNLDALLAANYCDTSSLIDREVFDRGLRYPEDVVFGYEDWDLVLSMAEAGIYGEPARAKTLLYRTHGFTRSDLVAAGNVPFAEIVARRHPGLFNLHGRARLKGEWNPAVSVIALDALAESTGVGSVVTAAARQTCEDFELVISAAADVWPTELGCRLRRVPSALAASRAQALAHGLAIAGGRYALATYGSATALLADRSLIEKALRVLQVNPNVDVLAFGECGPAAPAFRLLQADEVKTAQLSALLWPATGSRSPPASLELSARQRSRRWRAGSRAMKPCSGAIFRGEIAGRSPPTATGRRRRSEHPDTAVGGTPASEQRPSLSFRTSQRVSQPGSAGGTSGPRHSRACCAVTCRLAPSPSATCSATTARHHEDGASTTISAASAAYRCPERPRYAPGETARSGVSRTARARRSTTRSCSASWSGHPCRCSIHCRSGAIW